MCPLKNSKKPLRLSKRPLLKPPKNLPKKPLNPKNLLLKPLPAAEESSYEAPAEESAEETVAEAPAEEPATPVADRSKPAETVPYQPLVVNASSKLDPKTQVANVEEGLDTLANNMESTLMGKDDLPLAVSGYMAFRLKNFHYSEPSPWARNDLARTSVDAVLNMNIVAMPNSYMTLWTNMSFPFALSGTYSNYLGSQPTQVPTNDQRVMYDHSTDFYSATINEEMNFGVDIRAGVFGAYVTAGGVIWANASPLTMWERETNPRFAWQYELFEDEKTVSTYYKEKVFKPVKEGGRAFWTNRSFGGVFANFYQLPFDMKAHATVCVCTVVSRANLKCPVAMTSAAPFTMAVSPRKRLRTILLSV